MLPLLLVWLGRGLDYAGVDVCGDSGLPKTRLTSLSSSHSSELCYPKQLSTSSTVEAERVAVLYGGHSRDLNEEEFLSGFLV